MNYFVVMVEYPDDRVSEAVVNPEITRRGVVSRIQSGEYPRDRISFIHHITMNDVPYDVTDELIAEAGLPEVSPADLQALTFDHARDLRKNHEVV